MCRQLPALLTLALCLSLSLSAAPLTTLSNATLVASASNDGDSFHVAIGTTQLVVRLYAVDCAEASASSITLLRVREQMRYFGHTNPALTVTYGAKAAAFARRALSRPFSVHTIFASALGSSGGGRVYAFVTTADGDDLGMLLVRKGLARTRGISRSAPDGTSSDELQSRLRDAEVSAIMARRGIWSVSDPDSLVALRAAERAEGQALAALQQAIRDAAPPVDINSASIEELKKLHGVGDARAKLIVGHRPYTSLDELADVKGIPSSVIADNANRIKLRRSR
jgi:DNA uptake protein ComE-like DNA-binding protein